MHTDIQTQGFDLTDGLRDYTERRLAYALGRSAHHVNRVAVLLADINGPRGGVDKRCRIRVRLAPSLEVVVEDTQADLYAAIDRAAERTGRTVARSVGRQRGSRFASRAARNMEPETAVQA
ncbi:MAG: HPF/RaiA family ribosome-associated protein [Thiobacillaceae bacterium]|jgi:ribosomal subunit interface protein|nr:HPF/RaiA family ribosome-associated protein [Thiobacillaceae bacterium]